jgi:predicted nucleotidyltransferase
MQYAFWETLRAMPWVRSIQLFGSRARGTHSPRADIDVALDCSGATAQQWDAVLRVAQEPTDTLLKIDAVRLDALAHDDPLRLAIQKEGIYIYGPTTHSRR